MYIVHRPTKIADIGDYKHIAKATSMPKKRHHGNLPTESIQTLDNPNNTHWDQHCDLLVVGLGAAGAATAITSKESGLDVQVADRFGMGGATAKSGGIIYAGGGTPYQQKAGYEDTSDAMFNYLRLEVEDAVSEPTLRRFCDDSLDLLNWLESLGAEYETSANPPKTSYPPHDDLLYYSGNEAVAEFARAATPAPRGHRTKAKGGPLGTGKELFRCLRTRVDALNIPVLAPAAARRLIQNGDGEIIGAEVWQLTPGSKAERRFKRLIRLAEKLHNVAPTLADRLRSRALTIELADAMPLRIRTNRGVALTTGGFIFNRDMVHEHAPAFENNMRLGATGCDGSGIRLGQSAGGQAARLHKASSWRFINPPSVWPTGIAVDDQGERFCNEESYGARLGVAMCESHKGRAWLILDVTGLKKAFRQCLSGSMWAFQRLPALLLMLAFPKHARSISGLAHRLGIAPEPLNATVHRYNLAANGEQADALEKSRANTAPLETPPYYALDISVHNPLFPCPAITLGGLSVDEQTGAVQNQNKRPIPGLYAAGRAAVGIASNSYISGLSLADCLWSGRRAGAAAASDSLADYKTAS